jgi:hypothetical protein
MDMIAAIVGIVAGVISGIAVFILRRFERKIKKNEQEEAQKRRKLINAYFTSNYDDLLSKYVDLFQNDTNKISLYEFKTSSVNDWTNLLLGYSFKFPLNQKDIEKIVKEKTEDLNKRLAAIEERFPKASTIDKVASVNDAILATKIETLAESMRLLREQMLTKWDVAKIVFTILGALGVITAIIFGALAYLK